jgi:hypothetical protein
MFVVVTLVHLMSFLSPAPLEHDVLKNVAFATANTYTKHANTYMITSGH